MRTPFFAAAISLGLGVLIAGCTVTATTSSSGCMTDSTVSCSAGTGYSCTGSAQPEDSDPGLVCNTDGAGDFCCSSSSCNYDPNVTGCESGTQGYSCATGSPSPDSADPTLVCSVPTTSGNLDTYCCFTNTVTAPSGATCEQDPTVSGCQPDSAGNPSYGFSCTGTDTPDMDFSGITCSSGTAGMDAQNAAATLFCCTYQ